MHSRAYLLLKRDLANLQRFPLEGMSAGPCSDLDMFQWQARLQGLSNTPWEGGVFHLRLRFNAEFNSTPPTVQFMTIPFHPNIDPSDGTPCCHLLSAGWTEDTSIPALLIALQALLSNPEPDSGCVVNTAASQMLREAPHAYHQMAQDCVTASLRVNAGLAPYEEDDSISNETSPTSSLLPPRLPAVKRDPHPVSFDDYFNLWRGIATSRPLPQQSSPRPGSRDRTVVSAHRGDRRRRRDMQHKLQQHHALQQGQGGTAGRQPAQSVARQCRMKQLQRVFLDREGEEEAEVDQLVQWSRKLDDIELSTPQTYLKQ